MIRIVPKILRLKTWLSDSDQIFKRGRKCETCHSTVSNVQPRLVTRQGILMDNPQILFEGIFWENFVDTTFISFGSSSGGQIFSWIDQFTYPRLMIGQMLGGVSKRLYVI